MQEPQRVDHYDTSRTVTKPDYSNTCSACFLGLPHTLDYHDRSVEKNLQYQRECAYEFATDIAFEDFPE